MKRETLRIANMKKNQKVYEPPTTHPHPARKQSELNDPDEILNKTKTLTTIARQKTAKEKALQWPSQTGKEPYKNHWEEQSLQNAKKEQQNH